MTFPSYTVYLPRYSNTVHYEKHLFFSYNGIEYREYKYN